MDHLTVTDLHDSVKISKTSTCLINYLSHCSSVEGLSKVTQPELMAKPLTIRFINELGWFEYITRFDTIMKINCHTLENHLIFLVDFKSKWSAP